MKQVGPGIWDNLHHDADVVVVYLGGYKSRAVLDAIPHMFGWDPNIRVIAKSLIGTYGSERVPFEQEAIAAHHDEKLRPLVEAGGHKYLIVAGWSAGTIMAFDLASRWEIDPPSTTGKVHGYMINATPHRAYNDVGQSFTTLDSLSQLIDVDLNRPPKNLATLVDIFCEYLVDGSPKASEQLAAQLRFGLNQVLAGDPMKIVRGVSSFADFVSTHGWGFCHDLGQYVGTRKAVAQIDLIAQNAMPTILLRGSNDTICGERGNRWVAERLSGRSTTVPRAGHNPVVDIGMTRVSLFLGQGSRPEIVLGTARDRPEPFTPQAMTLVDSLFRARAPRRLVDRTVDWGRTLVS